MAGRRGFTMVSMLNTRWRNCIHKTQKKYHITNSIMNGFRCKIIQRKQMEEEKRSKDITESQTNIDVNCIIPSGKWWIGYKSVNRQKNRTWQKRLSINWHASYKHALAHNNNVDIDGIHTHTHKKKTPQSISVIYIIEGTNM